MKEKKIFSIEKGWGEGSSYYTIKENLPYNFRVDEIKEETRIIGKGYYNNLELLVYCGYRNGEKIFEIEANGCLTITYSE